MVNGKHKGKTLFLDFYMERCPYCYYIVNDFNRLISELTEEYGEDKVAFLKINGPNIKPLAQRYNVRSYPKIIGVAPNKEGTSFNTFNGDRDFKTMRKWMVGLLGPAPGEEPQLAQTSANT